MVLCADDPLDYQQQIEQPFTPETLNLAGSERFKVHAGLLFLLLHKEYTLLPLPLSSLVILYSQV